MANNRNSKQIGRIIEGKKRIAPKWLTLEERLWKRLG